jgi:hypothetical protein
MTHELITLAGYRTGGVESPTSIRHGFAFDLTGVNLRDRVVVSAELHLRPGSGSPATATVRLSDRADQVAYGQSARASASDDVIRVPLTADAIADLRQAGGGFFAVDAAIDDVAGKPQRLPSTSAHQILVRAVEENARVAAAA